MLKISLYVLLFLMNGAVLAESSSCRDIINDIERLACFDEVDSSLHKPLLQHSSNEQLKVVTDEDFSLLTERWELDQDLIEYAFRAYKPVYFTPLFYSSKVNSLPQTDNARTSVTTPLNLDQLESKLQLSFKTKLLNDIIGDNGDLWFGYTQSSRWQVYNTSESRPFRETNHEPEFMFVWRTKYSLFGLDGRLLSLSLNHQSNGQNEPLSRSWNRIILTLGLDRPNWVVQFRPWWRIPETSATEDENPEILDYVGRGEILIVHRQKNSHQISMQIRHSFKWDDAKGSIKLEWSYPCFDRLRCHAQVFNGYGESLIDYNHETTAIGLGVALVEWF